MFIIDDKQTMPRPFKNRCIKAQPVSVVYKPAVIPARELEWVTLGLDEFEAIRLLDHEGMDQQQASEVMGVSRPTITRIYAMARKKIATALTLGQAICIEGGPVLDSPAFQGRRQRMGNQGKCRHRHGNPNLSGE